MSAEICDSFEWRLVHEGHGRTPNIRSNAASWNYKNGLWIVCGSGSGLGKSSEVWRFDLVGNAWARIEIAGDCPPSRDGLSGAYLGEGKFVIFGGQGFSERNVKLGKEAEFLRTQTYSKRDVLNDLWLFDCDALRWAPIHPDGLQFPMGRRGHSCLYVQPAHSGSIGEEGSVAGTRSSAPSHHPHSHSPPPPLPHEPVPASAHPHSHRHPKEERAQGAEGVAEHSLLVFGGAGMELSKFTELLYCDLWSFSFASNLWTRLQTRGLDPPPLSEHKAVRWGEHMLVVGGLGSPSLDSPPLSPHELLALHLPTATWSKISLSDTTGGLLSLRLCGFSLARDAGGEGLVVFGGNEVIDPRTAAISRTPPARLQSDALLRINLKEKTLSAVEGAGDGRPERRVFPLSFGGVSADKERAGMRPSSPLKGSEETVTPLLFVYGGCSAERGGYCTPSLFRLSQHTLPPAPPSPSSPPSRMRAHLSSPTQSLAFGGTLEDWAGGEGSASSPPKGGSIWESLQMRRSADARQAKVRPPSNWQEMKLSLTASMSERVFDSLPPFANPPFSSSPARPTSHRPPSRGTKSRARSPKRDTASRLLSKKDFSVRSVASSSRGGAFSPWHLPTLPLPGSAGLSPSSSHLTLTGSASAPQLGGNGGQGASMHSLAGVPAGEREELLREERRKRVQEIKQTLKPLLNHQTKVNAREKFQQLFPGSYPPS